ncbi:hypothetical protein CH341_12830 [Rhodoplanes roseus]|uniref:HTH araC/xylS-type domain-containing protein n=2 Tax=Rhodoplanes roseus TaxID=29409 RepID=A0A327L180_9BRAD|nr:hypothetical protein CH341_12830 [Rhodoplanes roseus]
MREATAELCDVTELTAADAFQFRSTVRPVGTSLLLDSVSTGVSYVRTPTHIARGDIDHYLVSLCREGEMQFASGRRHVTVRAGDICLVDMAQPNQTWLTEADGAHSRMLTLVLPRALLAPRLANPDSTTAALMRRGDDRARLLASQITAWWDRALPVGSDVSATIEAMADIVAGAVGSAAAAAEVAGRADRHLLLAMIKRHIQARLETDDVTAEAICREFRISRASLYRLFEAEGGLTHYVQERRLDRALRLLVTPETQYGRLIDLALDLRFSSDSTFVRAFRRRFGMTPGEIREIARAWLRDAGPEARPADVLRDVGRA